MLNHGRRKTFRSWWKGVRGMQDQPDPIPAAGCVRYRTPLDRLDAAQFISLLHRRHTYLLHMLVLRSQAMWLFPSENIIETVSQTCRSASIYILIPYCRTSLLLSAFPRRGVGVLRNNMYVCFTLNQCTAVSLCRASLVSLPFCCPKVFEDSLVETPACVLREKRGVHSQASTRFISCILVKCTWT